MSGFDLLILADLLFNHSEHSKLISSVQQTLKKSPEALALVFFTPYRPWLLEKDLAFFDLARGAGFTVERLLEHVMEKAMFESDRGVSSRLFSVPFSIVTIPRDLSIAIIPRAKLFLARTRYFEGRFTGMSCDGAHELREGPVT